jgi:FixJ family two-component response regulator
MNLSEITVKMHRGQAMKKMESCLLDDFVLKAEAHGVKSLEPGTPSRARNQR